MLVVSSEYLRCPGRLPCLGIAPVPSFYPSNHSRRQYPVLLPIADSRPTVIQQVACIREAYENKYGRSLAKTIQKKFHGNMEDGLLSLLFDPIENFARGLKAAFHGMGTDKVGLVEGSASPILGNAEMSAIYILSLARDRRNFALSRFTCAAHSSRTDG